MTLRLGSKLLVVASLVVSCGFLAVYIYLYVHPWRYSYSGDGIFTDKGFSASSYRYVLKLDELSLANSVGNKRTYFVGSLPQTSMRVALRFVLAEGESRESIDNLKIRLVVSASSDHQNYFQYKGKLYSQGEGFTPTSYMNSAGETVIVMYEKEPFMEPITIFGRHSGLYQREARIVEFELLEPIEKPLRQNQAELIIFGGGWK